VHVPDQEAEQLNWFLCIVQSKSKFELYRIHNCKKRLSSTCFRTQRFNSLLECYK
jgi:hypothetical protein